MPARNHHDAPPEGPAAVEATVAEERCATAAASGGRGCCASDVEAESMGRAARGARAGAGFAFLGLAGALSSRSLPGKVALWPAALVPAWFGISHLIAAMIRYRGCPELGAIPSVMLARRVETPCGPWERFDKRYDRR